MRPLVTKTVPAAIDPVTLDEAKDHLRIDSTAEDALITGLIGAATRMAEAYTERQFIAATYTLVQDDFPEYEGSICLPRTPLSSVSSIVYIDSTGSAQTLSTDVYEITSDDHGAKIVLKPGQTWPETQSEKYSALTTTFVAGYGSNTTDVPAAARAGILMIVGHLFENREAVSEMNLKEVPMGAKIVLDCVSARTPV